LGAFVQKKILDEREGKMTHSSVVWATDPEANDLGDDKPTSSRSRAGTSTSLAFDDRGDNDNDDADFVDAEEGWYVLVLTFTRPKYCKSFDEESVSVENVEFKIDLV
jgi:hypothetical protein